ncbi:hypothetical protein CASFOL_026028 [Castilleja foliolosa]|uniref:Uncharacterized protein n=1 Tax=Castilleja foliolosa TaxID=1961234 RepID=A0ABD3CU11_9LAMI
MLTSQGVVLATAMAVSAGTIFLFDHLRGKYFPQSSRNQVFAIDGNRVLLKSCLSSGKKKREKEEKKRVRFANDVKDSNGDGELYRKTHRKKCAEIQIKSCGNEIVGIEKMPQNRAALYSGILRDRVQRMEYSY